MKNSLFYCLVLFLLIGCQPFEKTGYISIKNQTYYPITDLKITYISAQKTYSLGTLYPYSEYKYAINYEHHNEDSIKLSYLDKSDKKINHEVAPYVAKYDKKNYGITIK
ncbi:hypothetical protein [Acinetobacter lwoffii]|uniref:hypothetical protein n=1 Tax=Acinetobacter lwoffii TaxID=28090 RepID=UPI001443C121|nr:hypothetical protein [Acinetobacter lwoffii]NKS47136.1 hypothetical protein [Acinetobacter lwoffii]